jgi:preprotein translocase subunit YajC
MTNEVAGTVAGAMTGQAQIWTTWVQLGFSGLCLVLLTFIGWLVRALIRSQAVTAESHEKLSNALAQNTEVTRGVSVAMQQVAVQIARCTFANAAEQTGRSRPATSSAQAG